MNRLHALKKLFVAKTCNAVIISNKESITYFTGLISTHPTERESFLLVTPQNTVLYHSLFIKPLPHNRSLICVPMTLTNQFQKVIQTYCNNLTVVGIEKDNLTVSESERLQTMLIDTTFVAIDDLSINLRKIKDSREICLIKKSRQITSKSLKWAQKFSKSSQALGITEIQFKQLIENQINIFGGGGFSFPTIVAFDHHSAFPHHVSNHRRLTANSIVLVDVGAKVKGYCADMTRTWSIGQRTPLFIQIESIVKKAHAAGLSLVRTTRESPIVARDIDQAVRQVITNAGFAQFFIHNTGHGIGLTAHEPPSISSNNQAVLEPNTVITIEPGIYLPKKFGYRHEDTVIID